MHVLFVCSGNTCRSPMAEALFTDQLRKMGKVPKGSEMIAGSAGIYAFNGSPASHEAIKVMAELGIDISHHRARRLNEDLVQWADLILTMTEAHYREIIERYDVSAQKIHTLAAFSQNQAGDIIDPFGSGIPTYRQCARQMQSMVLSIIKKLKLK